MKGILSGILGMCISGWISEGMKLLSYLEHRMGFEPMNTGFADQRVSHFAIGALFATLPKRRGEASLLYFGCATVRRYGFTVL
jgi:hypothetical protein